MKMLRMPAVTETSGLKQSQIYSDISDELFPPPVKIGKRAAAWPEDEVDAVIAARIAGKSNGEIRELVRALVLARATKGATLLEKYALGESQQVARDAVVVPTVA